MKILLLFSAFLVFCQSKPVDETELPHSREFYAGYIKAITDNFDQLFDNDRETRSLKDDLPEKKLHKRSASAFLNDNSNDFDETTSGDGSGVSEVDSSESGDDSEMSDSQGSEVQSTDKELQKEQSFTQLHKTMPKMEENKQENVREAIIARRSEEVTPAFEGGDGSDGDIRDSAIDMQKSSRDHSPDDLAKISQSTITFLPTNVRNYKSTPFVARLFHYSPAAIPFGDFPQEPGPGESGTPYARQYLQTSSFVPEVFTHRYMFGIPYQPSYVRPYDREFLSVDQGSIRDFAMRRSPEAVPDPSPSPGADAKSAPDSKPDPNPAASPAANPAPVANAGTNNNQQCCCCCPCCCHSCPCCCCNNAGGNNNNNNNNNCCCCCPCCHHCHHHCHHCCHHHHCCCCQPVHHVTHHHHCCNHVCHHHHHHQQHDHECKIHPHHECCHHCHDHCHTHPVVYNHLHHHTPIQVSCNDHHCATECGGGDYGLGYGSF